MASTPVTRSPGASGRPSPGVATGPAWLSGVDPNVLPAAGLGLKGGTVRPLTPPPTSMTKEEATVQPRFFDRAKPSASDKQPEAMPPLPQQLQKTTTQPLPQKTIVQQAQPVSPRPVETPTANTPFRATGANGAPVYAGPPAYRWYGWGTVTPGANPLAPSGQYPKASANWYSITGATPGAFPVPVSNDTRVMSGTEPPNYGLTRSTQPAPQPTVPVVTQPEPAAKPYLSPPAPQPVSRPEPPKFDHPTDSKFLPGTSVGVAPIAPPAPPSPVTVPTISLPPAPKPVTAAPPTPQPPKPDAVALPALPQPKPDVATVKPPAVPVAPPAPVSVPTMPASPAIPPAPKPEPVAVLPPLPAIPDAPVVKTPAGPPAVPSVAPPKPALPTDHKATNSEPKPLPTSVTTEPPREEHKWQTAPEPATPAPGTWTPAQGMQPLPTVPVEHPSSWQQGNATVKPVVARGQMNDAAPDPVAALIQQMCKGRADGVEVRWTGTKKLQVCFEIRTAAEAQKLVADISRRPELTAYQIDFCVLVK
jgi:hypothetical protein